jgi:hypothetical protein
MLLTLLRYDFGQGRHRDGNQRRNCKMQQTLCQNMVLDFLAIYVQTYGLIPDIPINETNGLFHNTVLFMSVAYSIFCSTSFLYKFGFFRSRPTSTGNISFHYMYIFIDTLYNNDKEESCHTKQGLVPPLRI